MRLWWWIAGTCMALVLVGGIAWYAVAVDNAVKDFKARCANEFNGQVNSVSVFRGMTPIYGPNGQITGWSQQWGTDYSCLVNGGVVDELSV
jgi:hypothetical protein